MKPFNITVEVHWATFFRNELPVLHTLNDIENNIPVCLALLPEIRIRTNAPAVSTMTSNPTPPSILSIINVLFPRFSELSCFSMSRSIKAKVEAMPGFSHGFDR